MLQRMGADDPVMPFAVWNALSEREYEPAIPDDLEAADTGYAGLGLRARSLVRRDEREDGALLGMMASSTWPSDTPPPTEPDVYVFSAGLVSVVCPPGACGRARAPRLRWCLGADERRARPRLHGRDVRGGQR